MRISDGAPVQARRWRAQRTAVLAAAAVLLTSACERQQGSASHELVERLAQALGNGRRIEARLSGGFGHGTCTRDSVTDRLLDRVSCQPLPDPFSGPYLELVGVSDELRAKTGDQPTGPTLHAEGVWRALTPLDPSDLDDAVEALEAAMVMEPSSAQVRSDLAAVYLKRAHDRDQPGDLFEALLAADEAVRINPALPEAVFNRALALESLKLTGDALSAWSDYLSLDDATEWAAEARAHVDRLSQPTPIWSESRLHLLEAASNNDSAAIAEIVSRFPGQSSGLVGDSLLQAWAKQHEEPDAARAAQTLSAAAAIAKAISLASGDSLIEQTVGVIHQATITNRSTQLARLASAHTAYSLGRAHYRALRIDSALAELEQAIVLFEQLDSPMMHWARYYEASGHYQQLAYDRAADQYEAIGRSIDRSPFPALKGQLHSILGSIQHLQSNHSGRFAHYVAALRYARMTANRHETALLNSYLAFHYQSAGQANLAWRHRYASLKDAYAMTGRLARFQAFADVAFFAGQADHYDAAIYFLDEQLKAAREMKSPAAVAGTLRQRAPAYAELANVDAALQDIERVTSMARQFPDSGAQVITLGDLSLIEGEILQEREPTAALRALDVAYALYQEVNYRANLIRLHLARVGAYRTLADTQGLNRELGRALDELELRRGTVDDLADRVALFDHVRPLFDEMVSFQIEFAGDDRAAFGFLEQVRSRTLADALSISQDADVHNTIGKIQRGLDSATVLVDYGVVRNDVYVWVITGDTVVHHRLSSDGDQLRASVDAFSDAILERQSAEEAFALAGELYAVLIAPFEATLAGHTRVVLVPDQWLHLLPFAALRAGDGRFLIERHELSYAPSASLSLHVTSPHPPRESDDGQSLVVVANPITDERLIELDSLRYAELEAQMILGIYPTGTLLARGQATKQAFLEAARDHEITHFAGHAVVDRTNPLQSYVALTPSDGPTDMGVLTARELFTLSLGTSSLVVLASCSSAGGPVSATEGISSVVRAFIAAGVPQVIGSLWEVNDRTSVLFFETFYTALDEGLTPAQALRAAQMRSASSDDHLVQHMAAWAGFQLVGHGLANTTSSQ